MAELDSTLITSLKQAKGKEMFFAFIPKGSDGKLIVSKKKIPPKDIADAKKEIGGGSPVIGKCFGPLTSMVFKVTKTSATLGSAIKKVAKRDSGLALVPEIQLASDAEADEEESTESEAPEAVAATPRPAAPEAPEAPEATEESEAEEGEGEEAPTEEEEIELGAWQAARQNAIKELRSLATKVAGTKHASAAGVLKEINMIITKLPEKPKLADIPKLEAFIREEDTITAAEESPGHFHDLKIRAPLLSALEALRT